MAAGPRGLLAFWMGGAAAVTSSQPTGVRGMLAPWMGGAAAETAGPTQAGYRGLLGFWIGGAAPVLFVEQPPELPPSSGGGRRRRTIKIDRNAWPAEYIALRNDEDDQLLLVTAQLIASGIIH